LGKLWSLWNSRLILVLGGTPVTEAATLSGANAATATGTVTFSIYSDPFGSHLAASGGTVDVANGVVPDSAPVVLPAGIYFWRATYSGDPGNAPSASSMLSGVEIVLRAPFWGLHG
jgi:Bacterial Ig-like domain (group 3)